MDKTDKAANGEVHVGEMLKAFIKKNRLSQAALARKMGIDVGGLKRVFKSVAVKTSVLYQFSDAFQHNFFGDLAATLPPHYVLATPDIELPNRIKELEEQLKLVTAERDVLKEVMQGR